MRGTWGKRGIALLAAVLLCVSQAMAASISDTVDTSETDKVTTSDKHALLLADVGAPAPSGAPGEEVEIFLPMVVNREYLPTERYYLRNINIQPDIPTTTSAIGEWPFELDSVSYVRHLEDMTYNSRADVYFNFVIAQRMTKGVYPITFQVTATVWRLDPVNGTNITEDVEFSLVQYVTVTENGSDSGETSQLGAMDVVSIDENGQKIPTPEGDCGDRITFRLPVVNRGSNLTDISVTPVVSAKIDEFPFVSETVNYGQTLPDMAPGDTAMLEWDFLISPYATQGNKTITFKASYKENGVQSTCNLSAVIYIAEGYEEPPVQSAPTVTVSGYTLTVDGQPVEKLYAGDEGVLTLNIRNNSGSAAYKVRVGLSIETKVLLLDTGESDTKYISSLGGGKSGSVQFRINARNDADEGPTNATVSLNYENAEVTQASATQTLTLSVRQPIRVELNEPVVYDGDAEPDEPIAVNLNIVNKGRSKIFNVSIDVDGPGLSMYEAYYGGDVLPAAQLGADFQIKSSLAGTRTGTVLVTFEDSDGEAYTQQVAMKDFVVLDNTPPPTPVTTDELEQPKGKIPVAAIVGGGGSAAAAAAAAFYFLRRHKK